MNTTEKISEKKSAAPSTPRRKALDLGFLSMKLPNALPRFAVEPLGAYDEERAAWAVLRESGRVECCSVPEAFGGEHKGGLDMSVLPSNAFEAARTVADALMRRGVSMPWDMYRPEVTLATINRVQQSDPAGFRALLADRSNPDAWRTQNSVTYTYHAAFPSSRMPASIREDVSAALATGEYGDVFVAWEAAWQEVLKLTLAAGARPAGDPLDPIAFAQHKPTGRYHILGTWDLTKLESYVVAEFES